MNVDDRVKVAKVSQLCYNCLNRSHSNNECKSGGCKRCKKSHNTLLHFERRQPGEGNSDSRCSSVEKANMPVSLHANSQNKSVPGEILLSTAMIERKITACVLLDRDSQSNFIIEKFGGWLHLSRKKIDLPVEGISSTQTKIRKSVNATIFSRDARFQTQLELCVIPRICKLHPSSYINVRNIVIPCDIRIANPQFHTLQELDVFLGAELFYDLLCVGHVKIQGHAATLSKTKLD